jgi:hypothetical protein
MTAVSKSDQSLRAVNGSPMAHGEPFEVRLVCERHIFKVRPQLSGVSPRTHENRRVFLALIGERGPS